MVPGSWLLDSFPVALNNIPPLCLAKSAAVEKRAKHTLKRGIQTFCTFVLVLWAYVASTFIDSFGATSLGIFCSWLFLAMEFRY